MHPTFYCVHLLHFWYFDFVLKFNNFGVLVVWLIDSFWNYLKGVSYSAELSLQLR